MQNSPQTVLTGARSPGLDHARRTSNVLMVFSLVVFVWGGYFPDSYGIGTSAAILLPWLALVLLVKHPAPYRINPSNNDVQKSLWMPLCLTGLPLALRAFSDAHVIDDGELLRLCFTVTLVGLALLAAGLREIRDMRRQWGEAHYLRLSPWGARTGAQEVDVDDELYARTAIGDERCVALGAGTFGVRWFVVEECARK